VWDVGGQDQLRTLWNHYFDYVDGLVFVIDSTDRGRLPLAKAELDNIYQYESMQHVPIMIIANKQDCARAMKVDSINDELNMNHWPYGFHNIQACCALTGDGLKEAFTLLAKLIRKQAKHRTIHNS
jgi:signal recognition particle receptor subunit beta